MIKPEPSHFKNIRSAIDEAERFIRAAKACLAAEPAWHDAPDRTTHAAMKRASLDLTKSLPPLR